jgi:hypothetical protein
MEVTGLALTGIIDILAVHQKNLKSAWTLYASSAEYLED